MRKEVYVEESGGFGKKMLKNMLVQSTSVNTVNRAGKVNI
jgi:hypothetical protein